MKHQRPETPLPRRYLTPEQAAEQLPMSADWIREQLRNGNLAGSKVGGRWLTTQASIDEMVAAGSNSTTRARRRRRRTIPPAVTSAL
ncbi:helix-turn-helix domain-containing protein [Nocardioides sp. TRM66260-LWL]|uniref:helix-turn-helix domain-containing protein n=1 Tax=Nocardioides sp. TRM66260-LWL TaxID=2874478 RepID=UPI001CC49A9F|nr:helix-turn-helix domain-containing protein [Nocardioides sp. TRM66260-LWL]MBZ5736518.1 helix-turn-helix domain-containing protein [Nocardioides sp. TRM66260-LWL]